MPNDKKEQAAPTSELKPLAEYVDDRVELIRQAFTCLKPKTIKNICPDFLKGKSVDKLQEMCLDEVLGVSTKRLMSIINATRCPTDTESDTDSDNPQMIEDHITLSEISSEDNFANETNSRRKKRTKIKKERDEKVAKKKTKKNKNSEDPSNGMSEKEMTVLELLELQARARAIRSQLALEPVTKIELDSDTDKEEPPAPPEKRKENPSTDEVQKKKKKTPPKEVNSEKTTIETKNVEPDEAKPPQKTPEKGKRVKLRRNFSERTISESQEEEKSAQQKSDSVKEEKLSDRESSPDVIAMHPSPETVLLSDSDEEKKESEKHIKPTENHVELSLETEELDYDEDIHDQPQVPKSDTPRSEECSNDWEDTINDVESVNDAPVDIENPVTGTEESTTADLNKSLNSDVEIVEEKQQVVVEEKVVEHEQKDDTEPVDLDNVVEKFEILSGSESSSSDSCNSETLEIDPECIDLKDSSDEEKLNQVADENQSWGQRWLRSDKVTKVMASSKLGNKVRDKVKKKREAEVKKAQEEKEKQEELEKQKIEAETKQKEEDAKATEVPDEQVGSISHYKKLLKKEQEARQERQTKSAAKKKK